MEMFPAPTEVDLRVQPAEVTAGDTVSCQIDLGEIDRKTRGCRVELGYRNTYKDQDRDLDRRYDSRPTKHTPWVPVQTLDLSTGTPLRGRQAVTLRVPPDAPPTIADAVEWQVRAVVYRRLGLDARATKPLVVRPAAEITEALAARILAPPVSLTAVMPMFIELSTRRLAPGETLTGTVTAAPDFRSQLRGLSVHLVQERRHHGGLTEPRVDPSVMIAGGCELQPGHRLQAPFRIDLPADAVPCFDSAHCSQHLYLEIVADLPVATDEITRFELLTP